MLYYGRQTVTLSNSHFSIEVLADGGPRVVRLIPAGSDLNLMAEAPSAIAVTEWGPYHFLGGHRLWHAPEASPRSYEPDDSGVQVKKDGFEMLVEGPIEPHNRVRKSIRFTMDPQKAVVYVEHKLENHHVWPVEMAAWAITQMCMGGTGIVPLRNPGVHAGLLADRQVALWPYSDVADTRFIMQNDWFAVRGEPKPYAFKVGVFNPCGWIAYLYGEYLFVKRFEVKAGRFADYGCNAEIYVMDQFLEIETQSPMTVIEPGASMTHVEQWELIKVKSTDLAAVIEEAGLYVV